MEEPSPVGPPRKRPRSASPLPPLAQGSGGFNNNDDDDDDGEREDRLRAAGLRDPSRRNAALNDLLRLTYSHDANYAMSGDSVLRELTSIAMYDCLEWKQQQRTDDDNNDRKKQSEDVLSPSSSSSSSQTATTQQPVFGSKEAWKRAPTPKAAAWAEHCKQMLGPKRGSLPTEKMKTLEAVLVILRNLSFVAANLRLLAYSPDVVSLLIGCLYEGNDSSPSFGGGGSGSGFQEEAGLLSSPSSYLLAMSAMHVLLNLSPYIDISGQKLLSDKLFYGGAKSKDGSCPPVPDSATFGQAAGGSWGFGGLWLAKRLDTREDLVADVTRSFLLSLCSDYLISVWSLFPALAQIMTDPTCPRPVIMMAVDLLQELINHARVGVVGSVRPDDEESEDLPTIRAVLVNMPDAVLRRLVSLLYVPRLGPDSLDYIDPIHNIVTRVTTLKLLMGYDATVDTDVRDRALDVLVPLMELDSPRMAARLGVEPTTNRIRTQLFDALVPCLTANVGRNEASHLASQVFRELAKASENAEGLTYVQERLVDLASRNERVAHLVWNHLYVHDNDPAGSGEEEEEQEQA